MTLKLGTLMLLAASAAAASAQIPVSGDIYSQVGMGSTGQQEVAYSFGSWYVGGTNGDVALFPALFDEMLSLSGTGTTLVEGVFADADGIELSWNVVEKTLTVKCPAEKLGRTNVLITDINGASRGIVTVEESPATISISNYVPGPYVIAVAVDGKLVKTFKIILK